ncbi:MAG: tetratricopeptide repeat protein [Myxococcota bacterium]
MNITCPSCASRYSVDDSRVPAKGVTIRCPSCGHKFVVKPEQDAPVSLPPSSPPKQPATDAAVPLPGAGEAPREPRALAPDPFSIPLPGSAAAASPPPEPGLDELSFPSVESAEPPPRSAEDALDLGLEDTPPPRVAKAPSRPAFEPPDDLPGLPGQAGPPSAEPSLPDLPGLPQAELPDLPGLPDGPPDLPGLPEAPGAGSPADLPGLPAAGGPTPSEEILGFIDEQAAQVDGGPAGDGGEFRVRHRNGRVEGPFGRERIKAMIRAGQLKGGEDLSPDGVSWRAMTSVPEFNEALNQAAGSTGYGEVDLGGGRDGVAPVGLDLPSPSGLPSPRGDELSAGLSGDFSGLSLETGPLDAGAQAAALDEVDAMMDELGGPSQALPRDDGPPFDDPLGAPLGSGLGRGTDTGPTNTQDAAREVLEVGEIPELPPIWKTYRKQIIAFGSVAAVVLLGVYTQLFTPYGAFGIQGVVDWALTEPPPPPPPAPKPPPPKKVEAKALATLLQEGGYESLRGVIASTAKAQVTPESKRMAAKAAVYGALRYPNSTDFGSKAARLSVAQLGEEESLDATLARAGLAILDEKTEEALGLLPSEGGDSVETHWLRGLAFERSSRPAEAAEAFDQALMTNAGFAPAAAGLGRVALARGDQEAAAPWLLRSHALAPKQGPAGLLAAQTLDELERRGEALRVRHALARSVDGIAPNRRATLLARVAADYEAQGRISEVAELAIEAARLAPADVRVGALAASAELSSGQAPAALTRMDGHLQRNPTDVQGLIARGRAHMGVEEVAKAFLDLEAARKASPRSSEIPLWEGRFNALLGKMSDARDALRLSLRRAPKAVGARVSLGRLELEQGDVEQAFELARAAVQLEPQNPEVRLLLGDCLAERGQLEKALESYATAGREDPTLLGARLGQARMLRAQAERTSTPAESPALGAAFGHYIQAWEQAPEDPKVLFELGRALELEGQLGNALNLYQRAASLDADDVRPHLRMTAAYMEQASPDIEAAQASLKQAQSIERSKGLNEPEVRFWEARVALATDQTNEAVNSMREAVEAEPKNSVYHYWLGQSLEKNNSLYEAVAAYEEAVQLNSRFAAAQRALGWTALEQHRFQVARRWFNAYRKNEPTDGSIYLDIGTSFTRQNKDGPALKAFRKALEYDPDDTSALVQVGNILSRRGQEARARQMYAKAVELAPNEPEAVCLLGISQATRRVLPETKRLLERCKAMENAPQDLRETAQDILLTPR